MTIERGLRLATFAVAVAAGVAFATPAAPQARGPVIVIPDDMGPGSAPRPAPAPVPEPPAPSASGQAVPAAPGAAASVPTVDAWHVFNTANRTCLIVSGRDVKRKTLDRLAALLPPPLFEIKAGGCPRS